MLHYLEDPVQVVVVSSADDKKAPELLGAAIKPFGFNKAVLLINRSQAVEENLPPVLAETIPKLPQMLEEVACCNLLGNKLPPAGIQWS